MIGNRIHLLLAHERPLWRQAQIDTRVCLIAGLIAAIVASAIAISPFVTLRVASAYLPTEAAPVSSPAGAAFLDANGNTVKP